MRLRSEDRLRQAPPDLVEKLAVELRRAGSREIGGVLVGEHVGPNEFRIVDLSVQRAGGSRTCFVRRPEQHGRFLNAFFARTEREFERFNYLGEWHSHPSFAVQPSATDVRQMHDIVSEGENVPLFAVLMVVRLSNQDALEVNALAFRPHMEPSPVKLSIAERPDGDPPPEPVDWWNRLFVSDAQSRRIRLI